MYNKKIIRIIQKVLSPVLIPLSVVYWTVIVLRSFFYKTGFFSVKRIPVNVISIGNITAGGAGKTTLTVELAQALASSGLKLAVVTRGYGRKKISNEEVLVISDGEKIYYEPEQSGDEAYLMAKKLHGVPVVVSPEKYNAGVYSSEKLGAKTILLDDGFQHRQLHRDADIVLIDCLDPFGAGLLLPAGFLREPLSSLKRADVIILTNCLSVESQKIIKIKEKINKIKPGTTFIEMDYKIKNLRKLISGERVNISTLPSAEIAALCAIGNPDSFKETLKHAGLNIRKYYIYPDHHFFTIDEILKILENKPLIITTEKDSVKIESIIKENPVKSHFDSIYVLEICPEIISGKEIWEKIIKASQPYSLTETAPS